MNNLMNFENKPVEVFEWKGQALFNPYHCGECLGISQEGVKSAVKRMNEKQVIKLSNSDISKGSISNFRKLHNTGENFLTESGVYKLIFKSKKAEAERFQDWVTDEVLPQIRKTGSYTNKPTCIEDVLISSLQEMKAIRGEVQAVKQANTENQEAIQGIRDVVAINTSTMSWREDCRRIVVRIAHKLGGNSFIGDVNREIYELMRIRLKVRLDVKLTNLRRRMADEGVCVSKRNSMNYLDVIKDDARLVEGYVSIVKELAVKYGADIKEAM